MSDDYDIFDEDSDTVSWSEPSTKGDKGEGPSGDNTNDPTKSDSRQGTITGGDWEPWHEDPPSTLTGLTPDGGTPYSTYNQGFDGYTRGDYEHPFVQGLSKEFAGLTKEQIEEKVKDLQALGLDPLQIQALDPEVGIGTVEPGGILATLLGADPQGRFNIDWRDQAFPDYNPNYADRMFPTQSMKEAYGFNPDTGTWADTQLQGMFSRDIAGRQLSEIGRQAQSFGLDQNQMGQLAGLVETPVTDHKELEYEVAERLGGAKSYAQALADGFTLDQIKEAQAGVEGGARALGRSEDYEPYRQAYSGYLSKGLSDFFDKDQLQGGYDYDRAPSDFDVFSATDDQGKFVRDPMKIKEFREGLEEFSSIASLFPGAGAFMLPVNLFNLWHRIDEASSRRGRSREGLQNVNEVTGSNYELPTLWGDISDRVSERFSDIGEKFSGIPERFRERTSSLGSSLGSVLNIPSNLFSIIDDGLSGQGKGFNFSDLFGEGTNLFQYDPDPPVYIEDPEDEPKKKSVKKTWTYGRKKALADKLGKDISDLTDKDYEDNDEFDIVEYSEGGGVSSLRETEPMENNNNQKTITDSISLLNQFARTGTTGMMGTSNTTAPPPVLPQVLDREVATGGNDEEALRSLIMEDVNSYGGGAISGEGDGTSDDIEAFIEEDTEVMMAGGGGLSALAGSSGKLDNYLPQVSEQGRQAARLSDGEFVIPADVVANIGNGSTKAGNDQLYNMMEQVRKIKTGNTEQPQDMPAKPIDLLGIG